MDFTIGNLISCIIITIVMYFILSPIKIRNKFTRIIMSPIVAPIILFTLSILMLGGFPDVVYELIDSITCSIIKVLDTKLW